MIRWRLLVAEALILLIAARLFVACLPLGRWRRLLGPVAQKAAGGSATAVDRLLASAVARAAARLGSGTKCLPRAITLFWMLSRRQRPAQLVIGVLPGIVRGSLDDLHAWVECGSEIVIGALDQPFQPLVRFDNRRGH